MGSPDNLPSGLPASHGVCAGLKGPVQSKPFMLSMDKCETRGAQASSGLDSTRDMTGTKAAPRWCFEWTAEDLAIYYFVLSCSSGLRLQPTKWDVGHEYSTFTPQTPDGTVSDLGPDLVAQCPLPRKKRCTTFR
ncbi:hypothetical protein AAFF_G00432730 [Aldrovandia affinis]|uniref:Uncharacterized protein n=1 Tax=Aldrovandia affinis TaxID=143900 RepID=A0AAD7SAU2_9TELE|nr:hypothetical protein AAFF_G00432730 [Aldrovandia affinis]